MWPASILRGDKPALAAGRAAASVGTIDPLTQPAVAEARLVMHQGHLLGLRPFFNFHP